MSTTWDPAQYARFADHRGRPFADLLSRVGAVDPVTVVDLGCGDGPLTLGLADRWPGARIVGVDHSPQMLDRARSLDPDGRVEWIEADLSSWRPDGPAPDVVLSNAALQWVPDHRAVLDRWADALPAGGWLAFQVPGNHDAPSHALMREVAAGQPAAERLARALDRNAVASPAAYLDQLSAHGLLVDAWETTYSHVLDPAGEQANPVLEWVKGTGLRPALEVLTDPAERASFLTAYDAALREAYPRTAAGVVLGFRRIFCVAHRPAAADPSTGARTPAG